MDECYKHLEKEAVSVCTNCDRPFCEECRQEFGDELFCSINCVDAYRKSLRKQTIDVMTSKKSGFAYSGFLFLALYLMYIVYKYQKGGLTISQLLPHIVLYSVLALILAFAFLLISLSSGKD